MNKRQMIAILLLFSLLCFLSVMVLAEREQRALSDKLIRLHVIAASDSPEDQTIKLRVRDAILAAIGNADWKSREEAETSLRALLPSLENAAKEALSRCGAEQEVKITLCPERYPTRIYPTFRLPAGEYLSLRVVLGEGAGKNWWCVVYPSFCTAAQSELPAKAASAGFTEREVKLITADTDGVRLKFKLLEWLNG